MIRNSEGMALTELMFVIIIVGIMAAMAIPMISGSRPKLKAAARDIVSNLQVVRLNAMRDGKWARARIFFNPAAKTYTVSHLTSGADTSDTGDDVYTDDKIVKLSDYFSNIRYGSGHGAIPGSDAVINDGVTFPGNHVTFRSDGSAVVGGAVYVMDEKTKDTIAVSVLFTTGRVHTRTYFGKGGWSK